MQVEAADAQGRRALSLHSRDEAARVGRLDPPCDGCVGGARGSGPEAAAVPLLEDWPPAGATPLDVADIYARLSARGLDYGPVFQGLTGIWRLGDVVYGQVALPAGAASGAGEYGIHPALFDAALHVLAAAEGFAADDEARRAASVCVVGRDAARARGQRAAGAS